MMMLITKLGDYLKLSILLIGLLIGVQVPGFVAQYGHNLDARVAESSRNVAQFQDDADQYFHGDLDKLIAHYAQKNDPVMVSGGQSIEALVTRNQQLVNAQQSFHQTFYSPYVHVLISPIDEIRAQVWANYDYQVVLNVSAIVVGLCCGLLLLALLEFTLFVAIALWRRAFIRKSKRRHA